MGIGELARLAALHPPQPAPDSAISPKDGIEREFILTKDGGPARFSIPGFRKYGCAECHRGERLLETVALRMRKVVRELLRSRISLKEVPLKQFIIQPYGDDLLHPRQFAHTTFDTIRIFPRTLIIDSRAYGLATLPHETLHLTQKFLGHVNELEAYGLNVRADPRFLILNFPYFADVVSAFFVPDFDRILKAFFARGVREGSHLPREVQWFLNEFDPGALDRLRRAVLQMEPLLKEVGRLNREHPLELAYLSDRTGNPALALELAAVKLLDPPPLTVGKPVSEEGFRLLAAQMNKNDNTALGYIIDRKKEGLLHIRYQLGLKDPQQRLNLYFHFLKSRYILPDGGIDLEIPDHADFRQYVMGKLKETDRMLEYKGLTALERTAGRRWEEDIKKELSALLAQ